MTLPLVTVIVNTYNDAPLLAECIDSALAQTWPNLEVLVYNNKSTDNTSAIVRGYTDPRVHLVEATEHTNLSRARNMALRSANGDFVCFLDSDDLWEPEKVRRQLDAMRGSGLSFCFTNFCFDDEGAKRPPAVKVRESDRALHSIPLEIGYPVALSTIMFAKTVLIGRPFDETTHITGDYRLVTKLARQGSWKMVAEPLATILRRTSGESATKLQRMVEELVTYSNDLRLEGEHDAGDFVAFRALEIGFFRGGKSSLRSKGFAKLVMKPRMMLSFARYFLFRVRYAKLITR